MIVNSTLKKKVSRVGQKNSTSRIIIVFTISNLVADAILVQWDEEWPLWQEYHCRQPVRRSVSVS